MYSHLAQEWSRAVVTIRIPRCGVRDMFAPAGATRAWTYLLACKCGALSLGSRDRWHAAGQSVATIRTLEDMCACMSSHKGKNVASCSPATASLDTFGSLSACSVPQLNMRLVQSSSQLIAAAVLLAPLANRTMSVGRRGQLVGHGRPPRSLHCHRPAAGCGEPLRGLAAGCGPGGVGVAKRPERHSYGGGGVIGVRARRRVPGSCGAAQPPDVASRGFAAWTHSAAPWANRSDVLFWRGAHVDDAGGRERALQHLASAPGARPCPPCFMALTLPCCEPCRAITRPPQAAMWWRWRSHVLSRAM